MGQTLSCLGAPSPARASSVSPPHTAPAPGQGHGENLEFQHEGLVWRSTLGSLHFVAPGFEDATHLLEYLPTAFRSHMHRLELRPGSLAQRQLVAALSEFGRELTAPVLRNMMLHGHRPHLLPALGVLLRYRVLDFSYRSENDSHCDIGLLGARHCTVLHRMAVAGGEQRHGNHPHSTLAERFSMLREAGVDLDMPCAHGETPLMWAVRWGSMAAARALVGASASVMLYDHRGHTPLHMAAQNGDCQMTHFLVSAGHGPDVRTHDRHQWTALHVAAAHGHCRVIRALQQAGANMNALDHNGDSPLLLAVRRHHPHTVRSLAKSGANVNLAHGPEHYTALHWAAQLGALTEVHALLEAGANVMARAHGGVRPLHLTGYRHSYPIAQVDIAAALLDRGAILDIRDSHGKRTIDVAGEQGNEHVFEFLVSRGAATPHHLDLQAVGP